MGGPWLVDAIRLGSLVVLEWGEFLGEGFYHADIVTDNCAMEFVGGDFELDLLYFLYYDFCGCSSQSWLGSGRVSCTSTS